MSRAGEVDDVGEPVTVLVARRVRPGKENEFERWASELTRAASGFDGFLGAGLLRPGHVGELWHVVYRFAIGRRARQMGTVVDQVRASGARRAGHVHHT